jgi:N-hydroxyarylamine O-acetyltransferase
LQLKPYLNRIGIDKIKNPSIDFLTELQNRHLLSIPFEDLDIPEKRIELDLSKIFSKIIPAKRGGFCYELNGLFHWLLTSLGFKTDMLSARVFNSRKQDFGPEFDHMSLIVHLDNDYLVDVGFGDSFRSPIEMPAGEVEDTSGHYRVHQTGKDKFELQKENENKWLPQYSFTTIPRSILDYSEMCDFQQDSPTSSFRIANLCTIATETGRITLTSNSLTITNGKQKDKIFLENDNEFYLYLKNNFDIEI